MEKVCKLKNFKYEFKLVKNKIYIYIYIIKCEHLVFKKKKKIYLKFKNNEFHWIEFKWNIDIKN